MKTNTLNVLLATASIAATGLIAVTKITAGALPAIPVVASYIAVAILVALVALDYRVGQKSYSAR
jgi:hypothetical protein